MRASCLNCVSRFKKKKPFIRKSFNHTQKRIASRTLMCPSSSINNYQDIPFYPHRLLQSKSHIKKSFHLFHSVHISLVAALLDSQEGGSIRPLLYPKSSKDSLVTCSGAVVVSWEWRASSNLVSPPVTSPRKPIS